MKKIILLLFFLTIQNFAQDFVIFSHRGAAALAPENTIAACEKAVESGAHYFEVDVRMSSDDSLVIMHDTSIDRTTDGTGNVSSMTFDQLRAVDAGSWFSSDFVGEIVPTLGEILDVALEAPYEVGVIIEIKSTESNIVDKVVELVKAKGMEDRVVISSFTFSLISKSKTLDATIPVQLFASPVTLTMLNNLENIGAEWAGTGSLLSAEMIDSAHAKNIKVNRWTVNSASTIKELIEAGYDAATTDDPILGLAAMDSTAPSTVVLEDPEVIATKVKLTWQEATDSESGVSHYEIYRSKSAGASVPIATVKNELTYIDETLEEEENFYYRVKAVNFAGILSDDFSNEVMATTGADLKAPKVKLINAYGLPTKVTVQFNERVDETSATTVSNYSISDGITISDAVLTLDSSGVILTTSEMASDIEYELSIVNITDLATIPNSILDTVKFNFTHTSFLENLVGAWDLDEGTGTTLTDLSGNSNDGTAFGGLAYGSGYLGNGLVFDGVDDYAEIPSSSTLDINTDKVTLSLWTKLAYLPADLPGGYGPLYDSDTDNYVLYEDKGNNELRFKVATSGGAERPGIPAASLLTDEWIHVVGVYDGAKAMIYMNGELMDSHDLTGTVNTGQVAKIGQSAGSFFEGSMDNIQVFASALTEEEVNFLYDEFLSSFIDNVAPEVESVTALGPNNLVFVKFSEAMDELNAELITNYEFDNGVTVNSAQLSVEGTSVILETSELDESTVYTLIVNGVKDLADIPNEIEENTTVTFTHKFFPEDLISYWNFDEAVDTFANDWTNTNTAFIQNNPEWIEGKTGNALLFDAVDDYVNVPESESLNIDTNGVTVSVWVILKELPSEMTYPYAPIYDSSLDRYVIYGDRGNNELRFKASTLDGAERPGIPADSLILNEWINITGVYNGEKAMIYMNGKLMDSHNLTGNLKTGQNAHIGQDGTSFFNGAIDNVQVYGRGLTDQEVKFLYSGVKTPTLELNNVNETVVNLEWNDVHDPLLGISGYNIYRDTVAMPSELLTFVKDTTGYSDQTRSEFTSYYYRVKAVDASGNEAPYFSNDLMITTEADLTAPQVLAVRTSGEADKVYINFDEILDVTTASEVGNYLIDNITVSSVEVSIDNKNVVLTVSELTAGDSYTLKMSNIKDVSQAENMIEANTESVFNYNALYDGLVSYFQFEELTDTIASDLMGLNNGVISNEPLRIDGIMGNALFFDGTDDYVSVPNSTSLDIGTEGVSVSVWVKLKYLPTEMPTSIGPIYDAPQDSYVIYQDKWNRELRFKVSTANGAERPGIPNDALVKGEWIHVVGVYDGTQALIYLNGEQKDAHTGLTGLVKAGQVARVGQDGSHYFNGGIDDLRIYNRGLTQEEVMALYKGDIITDVKLEDELPVSYSLSQNYPNPFNPSTKIQFSIPERADVTLEIFNVIGEKVGQVLNTTLNAGYHEVNFNATNLSSGIYFYRLKSGNFVEVKKMMFIK